MLAVSGPHRAGWLLGWWCARFHEGLADPEERPGIFQGAGQMAAFLWGGFGDIQQWEARREYCSEEEIAEALGCSVEEVVARAKDEGWTYIHVSEDSNRPVFTVHPNPETTG